MGNLNFKQTISLAVVIVVACVLILTLIKGLGYLAITLVKLALLCALVAFVMQIVRHIEEKRASK